MCRYCLPRVDDVPDIAFEFIDDMPCQTNPLGIKGASEVGSIGAPPAVINALLDALSPLEVQDLEMPATPERIWRAIRTQNR